jgi:MFS family permease
MLYVGNLVASITPGAGAPPVQSIMIALAIAGFCILGAQITMYAVAAHVYPTACRAAGVGWAVGIGRLGGVLSAFAGGVLMARAGVSAFFVAIAGILGLTVIAILVLRRHITPALTPAEGEVAPGVLPQGTQRVPCELAVDDVKSIPPRRLPLSSLTSIS